MNKWYESEECDSGIIIGGQVCFVRNLADYLFEDKISIEDQKRLLENVCYAVREAEEELQMKFTFYTLKYSSVPQSQTWIGRLAVPPLMMADGHEMGLLVSEDESVSILINGKEHICIQVSCAGAHIAAAVDIAYKVDDALNKQLVYAFSEKYGYLTANPFYTGTGMSASYLMHLPYLERQDYISKYEKELGQYGFTLRGHFDGRVFAPGSVYRVKNRKTLGISESEILSSLESLCSQLAQQEKTVGDNIFENKPLDEEDMTFRSYGLLKYSRKLEYEESLTFLSALRMGNRYHILDMSGRGLFAMMLGMQAAVLTVDSKILADNDLQGKMRAGFVHRRLPVID